MRRDKSQSEKKINNAVIFLSLSSTVKRRHTDDWLGSTSIELSGMNYSCTWKPRMLEPIELAEPVLAPVELASVEHTSAHWDICIPGRSEQHIASP